MLIPVLEHPVWSVTSRWLSCPPVAGHCQPVSALSCSAPSEGKSCSGAGLGFHVLTHKHSTTLRHLEGYDAMQRRTNMKSDVLRWWAQPDETAQRASGNQAQHRGCYGKSLGTPSKEQAACYRVCAPPS